MLDKAAFHMIEERVDSRQVIDHFIVAETIYERVSLLEIAKDLLENPVISSNILSQLRPHLEIGKQQGSEGRFYSQDLPERMMFFRSLPRFKYDPHPMADATFYIAKEYGHEAFFSSPYISFTYMPGFRNPEELNLSEIRMGCSGNSLRINKHLDEVQMKNPAIFEIFSQNSVNKSLYNRIINPYK